MGGRDTVKTATTLIEMAVCATAHCYARLLPRAVTAEECDSNEAGSASGFKKNTTRARFDELVRELNDLLELRHERICPATE